MNFENRKFDLTIVYSKKPVLSQSALKEIVIETDELLRSINQTYRKLKMNSGLLKYETDILEKNRLYYTTLCGLLPSLANISRLEVYLGHYIPLTACIKIMEKFEKLQDEITFLRKEIDKSPGVPSFNQVIVNILCLSYTTVETAELINEVFRTQAEGYNKNINFVTNENGN
jgi:hypothetical protein